MLRDRPRSPGVFGKAPTSGFAIGFGVEFVLGRDDGPREAAGITMAIVPGILRRRRGTSRAGFHVDGDRNVVHGRFVTVTVMTVVEAVGVPGAIGTDGTASRTGTDGSLTAPA